MVFFEVSTTGSKKPKCKTMAWASLDVDPHRVLQLEENQHRHTTELGQLHQVFANSFALLLFGYHVISGFLSWCLF
ncbi:hypothetical protein ASPFODRAFT_395276 [Aspergillus luchuensis CBS 106.47]|uniref:Uncharacterized protein n=1 Tax=Aspergillus luchuensis (strain CBS 106.47) TaxID=1137211 RepID=A0A1M3T2B3_ASPLC|nr:hypothetical protein ASPFODRAFT_395276 [Aspergillus luchuensis CBS 106.47]